MAEALELLVEAALSFEALAEAWMTGGVTRARLERLTQAADGLVDRLADPRMDLALTAHRVRCRGEAELSPGALHAASVALLAGVIARGVELRGEAKRTLARAALFAHLPLHLAGERPSAGALDPAASAECCANARGLIDEARLDPETAWWEAAWIAAQTYRHGRTLTGGRAAHPAARVVGVAAAFDALTTQPGPGTNAPLSPDAALATLARATREQFDPIYVTVLTAAVAALR